MSLTALAIGLAAGPITLVTSVFATEVLLGQVGAGPARRAPGARPRTIIVMPAHNEAAVLGATLRRVLDHIEPHLKLLVVADNCTDGTATIARLFGVDVVERNEPHRRGKSYALAFAADHLRADPPDVVIVLDADCTPEPGALQHLAAAAAASGSAVQAEYLLEARPEHGPMVQVSTFAFYIKNKVRQNGMSRLGAPALLTGTGMAFPWTLIEGSDLASGSLVEDLELGIDLSRRAHPPLFLDGVRVWSAPATAGATLQQRSRWEGGFLQTARRHALPLVVDGLRQRNWRSLWLALHLATPPLALLVMLNIVTLTVLAPIALVTRTPFSLTLLVLAQAAAAVGLALSWSRGGRAFLPRRGLLRLPAYLLWKIPLYLGLTRGKARDWVRTERQ